MSISKKAQQRLDFLCWLKRASLPPPILTTFYRGTIEIVLTSCITVWYGNCSAADRKTLQWTVNTAAKIIGAPLPSILDIFLARCSSKANSIVKDPTHPSHSLFQLLPSARRYGIIRAAPPDCSTAFFPRLWGPWTQLTPHLSETPYKPPTSWNMTPPPPPPPPKNLTASQKKLSNFFVQFKVCYTQVSGPVQTTCSNTLSSICTRDFHTLLCVHNPTKVIYVCLYTHALQSPYTVPEPAAWMFLFLHMYSICEAFAQLYSFIYF